MAQSILIFDFGTNEEAAQQARHKFEAWKQAFRLGDKAILKFERKSNHEAAAVEEPDAESKPTKAKPAARKNAKKKSADAEGGKADEAAAENTDVRILIRLSFSDHEKLSYQRWLDRIPSEEPFKSAKGETIRQSDGAFAETADRFDSLD